MDGWTHLSAEKTILGFERIIILVKILHHVFDGSHIAFGGGNSVGNGVFLGAAVQAVRNDHTIPSAGTFFDHWMI